MSASKEIHASTLTSAELNMSLDAFLAHCIQKYGLSQTCRLYADNRGIHISVSGSSTISEVLGWDWTSSSLFIYDD
ncbi:hypothetical protein LPJ61_006927, partial [Coemansia biformis]